MEENKRIQDLLHVKCNNCGAQMVFNAQKQMLHCENCGNEQAIQTATDKIVEVSITEALNLDNIATGLDTPTKAFHCNTCGAVTAVAADTVTITCSFCNGTNVNQEAFDNRVIRPFGILPFKIVKKDANERFKTWIGSGWFHPNDLKHLAEMNRLDGIYIPFWTYDAQTESSWTAESGYHYYETEEYTDSEGNTQTREVQRTRWVPSWGNYDNWFDDVTVVASGGIKQSRVEDIYPFTLSSAVNYEPKFMLGWKSEVYAKDVKQGFAVAENIMDQFIEKEIIKQIPGDTYRFLQINTRKSDITFKHLLLPIWVAAYQYGNKTYQVVVNGETGKISGEKPLSWIKITLAVLAVAIVAFAIYYFTKHK